MPDSNSSSENAAQLIAGHIASLANCTSHQWEDGEDGRFIFYLQHGERRTTQGVLTRDLRMALLVGGQPSEEATARFIDHIRRHLGETAAGLRFDSGVASDMIPPADLVKITEVPGSMQHDMLTLARGLGRQGKVLRRDRSLAYADRSVLRKTRRGDKPHLSLVTLDSTMLSPHAELACDFGYWKKVKGPSGQSTMVWVSKYPSDRLMKQVIKYVGDEPWPGPAVRGISTCPFLRDDGTVCSVEGYDEASGVFVDFGGYVFPARVPLAPENALDRMRAAIVVLAKPLRGYIFSTSEKDPKTNEWKLERDTDRARAIVQFGTRLAVYATPLRPVFVADAPTYGSGKTMLVELPGLACTGDDPPLVVALDDLTSDEMQKRIETALLSGTADLIIDNASGDLGQMKFLAGDVTARKIAIRLFFTQLGIHVDNAFAVSISANNAHISDDMVRRTLRARIDTNEETPHLRKFDFNPRDEVLDNRGGIINATLDVLEGYAVLGRPKPNNIKTLGSFEEWCRIVRDAFVYAGLPDVVESDHAELEISDVDEKLSALNDAMAHYGLVRLEPEGAAITRELTCAELIAKARARVREVPRSSPQSSQGNLFEPTWVRPEGYTGPPPPLAPELHDAVADIALRGRSWSTRALGRFLTQNLGRWHGGMRWQARLLEGVRHYILSRR